jgi:YfiH family protein
MDIHAELSKVSWSESHERLTAWDRLKIDYEFTTGMPTEARTVHQVHGVNIEDAASCSSNAEADGLIASEPGLWMTVKTADCVPIMFQAPGLAMVLHAGWRGIAQGIIGMGIKRWQREGGQLSRTRVGIGPHISWRSFEIGDDVVEGMKRSPFYDEKYSLQASLVKAEGKKWHMDLGAKSIVDLLLGGVPAENIAAMRTCTFLRSDLWPSYRRDKEKAGRIWTVLKVSERS